MGVPLALANLLERSDLWVTAAVIGHGAFEGCTSVALTSLPNGITSIGAYAFYGCTSLMLTSLPDGLSSIGAYAFEGCVANSWV